MISSSETFRATITSFESWCWAPKSSTHAATRSISDMRLAIRNWQEDPACDWIPSAMVDLSPSVPIRKITDCRDKVFSPFGFPADPTREVAGARPPATARSYERLSQPGVGYTG